MITDLFLPSSIALGLLAFGLLARWYVLPLADRYSIQQILIPLLLIHSFRYIGLAFLIPGVTSGVLDVRFAVPAAYGDLLAAVLAFAAIGAIRRQSRAAIPVTWLFNVVGTADLLFAVVQGLRFTADGNLGATYFIPAIAVPALLVSHAVIFVLLVRKSRAERSRQSDRAPVSLAGP